MDNDKITVIICCAGMGTRLGIGSTKALITIDGVPLIIQILKLLKDYTDIRIVVGYQADKVIEVFEKNSIPYELFSDVKANPTITNVQNGVAAFKASGADFIGLWVAALPLIRQKVLVLL